MFIYFLNYKIKICTQLDFDNRIFRKKKKKKKQDKKINECRQTLNEIKLVYQYFNSFIH